MSTPLEITFLSFEPSRFVEQQIREHVNALGPVAASILKWHVTVRPHHHYRQGDLYVLCVEADMPDAVIVVGRDRPAQYAHEDPRIAVRNTFAEVRRRVEEYAQGREALGRELADQRVEPHQVAR